MSIEVLNLSKDYESLIKKSFFGREIVKTSALSNINFKINQGERIAFIGPNGSGKTTLIKILSGLLLPSSGEVIVENLNPFYHRTFLQYKISTFLGGGSSSFWQQLPAIDTLTFSKYLYNIPSNDFASRLKKLDQILNFSSFYNRPLRQLSLGQKMKIELCSKILHSPKILFLDEPTLGLDVLSKFEFRKFLSKISEEEGITILLTSHDTIDIEEVTTRSIVINTGKIVEDTDTLKLKNKFDKKILCMTTSSRFNVEAFSGCNARINSENYTEIQIEKDHPSLSSLLSQVINDKTVLDFEVKNTSLETIIREMKYV